MEESKMNPLIVEERKNASFQVVEMSKILCGGEEKMNQKLDAQNLVAQDPAFNNDNRYFLSREERFLVGLQRSKRLYELVVGSSYLGEWDMVDVMSYEVDEQLPVYLHHAMFVPTISGQGTEEQREEWLHKASSFQVIGCYAQTELGHGSFLRGLETTATYDPKTQEFILDSPTLTSTKWWPGGLGVASTHAIVVAKLITKGVDHGPHNFIVQIRSLEDHKPLPGVIVGDIGPKYGYETMDNGFLRFNKVRIPRKALMMKYSKVSPEGDYHKPPHSKISYGTMVWVRATIVAGASRVLARALTIAIRYSSVRKQFPSNPDDASSEETTILNYQTQQYKLLPLLAIAYAFHFTKTEMMKMYYNMKADLKAGNFSSLAEVHAASAGLKAVTTDTTSNGIEVCRMACGGHGYSCFSGIPVIYTDYIPACTYEGENTVMLLQTARYLLKAYKIGQKKGGEGLPNNLSFFASSKWNSFLQEKCSAKKAEDLLDYDVQVQMFRHRVASLTNVVVTRMESIKKQNPKMSKDSILEQVKVDLIRATTAYCWQLIQMNYVNVMRNSKENELKGAPPSVVNVLEHLRNLFTLNHIEEFLGEFTFDQYLSPVQVKWVRKLSRNLLRVIRRDAVPLVDAFQFTDHILNSAIGRNDGNYAESLFKWAQKEPLNNISPPVGYKDFIQPLIHPKSVNTKSGKQCNNSIMIDIVGPQSEYCARHLVKRSESLYSFCSVQYTSGSKVQRCREIVLKRFGVCYKHFDTFLNSLSSSQMENTLLYLNQQVTLINSILKSTIPNSPEYHRKYKLSKKFESMIHQTEVKKKGIESSLESPSEKNINMTQVSSDLERKETIQVTSSPKQERLPDFNSFVMGSCPSIFQENINEREHKRFKFTSPSTLTEERELLTTHISKEKELREELILPPLKWFPK